MKRLTVLVVAGLVAITAACGGDDDDSASPTADNDGGDAPAVDTGPAPWPAPTEDVSARVEAAGLPLLTEEGSKVHYHAQLDIFLDGQRVVVPGDIGIDREARRISPLHTHDEDGTIHVEAEEEATYTLGQLFTQWGVRLTRECIGGYCAPEKPFRVLVNGAEQAGEDPTDIEIESDQEIAIIIGTPPR